MAWFFLWRRSEYLCVNGAPARHVIRIKDVIFLDANDQEVAHYEDIDVVQVHIRSSKTDQTGKGVHLRLSKSGVDELCPVNAAWSLLMEAAARGAAADEPLCTWRKEEVITCENMSLFAKRSAHLCGQKPEEFSTHSFRSGGATALFRGGAPDLAIQKFGRWASDTYKQYARIDDQTILGLAPRMIANVWRNNLRATATPRPLAGGRQYISVLPVNHVLARNGYFID